MSTIRCVYWPKADGTPQQPSFPATDQHPDAVRYLVGLYYVDALGGQPTQAEVDAVLGLDAAGQAESTRKSEIDGQIGTTTIGSNPAITFAQAKAMTIAQWNTWWGNNVTTAAQAIGALKWIALIVIRRAL